jgi:hypothetical protein
MAKGSSKGAARMTGAKSNAFRGMTTKATGKKATAAKKVARPTKGKPFGGNVAAKKGPKQSKTKGAGY